MRAIFRETCMANDKARVIVLYNYYLNRTAEEAELGDRQTREMLDALRALGHVAEPVEFHSDVKAAVAHYDPNEWIVFNWVEGIENEVAGDSRICAELDALGFTYTGNPPATLRLSVEKGRVKRMLERWNIPTPEGRDFLTPDQVQSWTHFPAIVKPVSQHCSAAVTRDAVAHTVEALRARIAHINQAFHEGAVVERFIAGREINVGIWGNGRPRVLPLREIDFSLIPDPLHQMVTWDSKWTPNSAEWNTTPVNERPLVSNALREQLEDIAIRTYRAFGCRDYARVDFRIEQDAQGNERPFVVDVNPNPDITADGGFAGACRAAGYSYGQAISNIIGMAVARRNRKNALRATLSTRRVRVALPA